MLRPVAFFSLIFAALLLISCGGSSSFFSNGSSTGTPGTVPISMSVQDSAPAGVTVLSFEIQITSAALQPGDAMKPAVPLLAKPTDVELEHLQSEPALLGNLNVPAGTYAAVTVGFANPRMTIFNSTAAPITVGQTVCAPMAPCSLIPSLSSASITVTTPPFPITLVANSPLGLLLHFDVNNSISSNLLTIMPTVDIKELLPTATGVIHQEHLIGTITSVTSPDFTLQPGLGAPIPVGLMMPPTFLIKTDSNTKYSFLDALAAPPCTTNGFSCLAAGETVNVTVDVMSDGSLLAAVVSLFEQKDTPAFEGTVVSVDPASNQFKMALIGGQWLPTAAPTASAALGVLVTVNVTPSTVYETDSDGFTLPAGLTFNGINDMIAGQSVEIQPGPTSVGPAANTISVTTLRVRLDETQVTAKVASIDVSVTPPTAFTIGGGTLPPLFSATPTIKVQTITTPPPTQFVNVTGVPGLSIGDTVSIGGLLFKTAATPTLAAEIVLKRVQCSAVAAAPTTISSCVMPE